MGLPERSVIFNNTMTPPNLGITGKLSLNNTKHFSEIIGKSVLDITEKVVHKIEKCP